MVIFHVENMEEFLGMVKDKNLELSTAFTDTILDNLNSEEEEVRAVDVYISNTDSIIEISVCRKDFIDTLEKNLLIHEYHEEYERCSKINEAIQLLKSRKNETV